MAKSVSYQCPNCGGVLEFNALTGRLKCKSCEHSFEEGQAPKALPIVGEAPEPQPATHVQYVGQFLRNAPWEVDSEGTEAAATAVKYSCPSCGGEVVAGQSAITASCPYCGNNLLVSGIATAESIPDQIIPFSITQDRAKDCMRRHCYRRWFLPRKFVASIEHVQGVYVPFYLFDVDVEGQGAYLGNAWKSGEKQCVYACKRAGRMAVRGIPMDASSNMPDAHMDSILPFDYSAMRDFSPEYAAGFLMQVADESPDSIWGRAEEVACSSFAEALKKDVVKFVVLLAAWIFIFIFMSIIHSKETDPDKPILIFWMIVALIAVVPGLSLLPSISFAEKLISVHETKDAVSVCSNREVEITYRWRSKDWLGSMEAAEWKRSRTTGI